MIRTLLLLTSIVLDSNALMLSQQTRKRPAMIQLSAVMDHSRRRVLTWLPSAVVIGPQIASAAEDTAAILDMKEFVDPAGLFYIQVPSSFYTLRRSAKGDLPDAKGQGRRGSSIFTAGNMAKAEVIAVERFPTKLLLEDNGIEATGDLSTFPGLGESSAIASLMVARREKGSATTNTQLIPDSLLLSEDGKELRFRMRTEIEVQKPELLMEQYGVSALYRITSAKATLRSNDGYLVAVFASGLERDYMGPDGVALERSVSSFEVVNRAGLQAI